MQYNVDRSLQLWRNKGYRYKMVRGLFAVYKPPGVTSAEITHLLKVILLSDTVRGVGISSNSCKLKVGHGGTLDKFAEGVLVIGVGEDCKKLGYFQKSVNKCYDVTGRLGVTTDSLDLDGIVIGKKDWKHVTKETLCYSFQHFCGEITQSTPLFSAVKHKGKRLSDYARESQKKRFPIPIDIQPPLRQVCIHSISLLDFTPPEFRIAVCCSSGTYMRGLVRDIAERLNTVGYVVYLRRTAQGPFTLDHAIQPDMYGKWSLSSIKTAIRRCSDLHTEFS